MRLRRRIVLKGGGALLALPLLESIGEPSASAAQKQPAFAIFFRQACGVASEQTTKEVGHEPERFWPLGFGKLTPANTEGRAVDELRAHAAKLLIVKGINMKDFDYGDGHARGALQGLTAQGPVVAKAGGSSEANGESIDHRIGRELNPGKRDSLFLYAGPEGGWLGGACISYRGPGQRRAAMRDPKQAYELLTGGLASVSRAEVKRTQQRQKSVNDLIRTQMQSLLSKPDLSQSDRRRLDLHFSAVRDLERAISRLTSEQEASLLMSQRYVNSTDGEDLMRVVRMHMDVAVLAVACGYTRSVAIQVGNGNDGSTRYLDPDTHERMENYHYISHRRRSHDASGDIIPGSDLLHHKIDRYFGQMFGYLLDKLAQYPSASGGSLLDSGVSVWYNDHGDGPAHGFTNIPFVLAGSCGGFFKQGEYTRPMRPDDPNHSRMLCTIASAVGVRNEKGDYLDRFGDASLEKGVLSELLARGA
ncbi:MAG TPA: DUF1552 domain-containing protein [Polyangiaceae bacterium]|nr:DUF1552 domain-containing protein [Polyangiaceae bacterium]